MKENNNSQNLQQRMTGMFEEYRTQTGSEPMYASCLIQFIDDGSTIEDTIKLDTSADEKNEDIFHFCNGLNDLKSLTEIGCENFIILDIFSVE